MKTFLILFLFFSNCKAQDEWFFKDILRGRSVVIKEKALKIHYKAQSSLYHLDLSGDGAKELIRFKNNDGRSSVQIYSSLRKKVLDFEFPIKGYDARVYKITRNHLSGDKVLTLFYFFEGKSDYINKKGTSAIYGIVIENNIMNSIKVRRLAGVWFESQKRETYLRRLYEVSLLDLNDDGQKELIINSGGIKKVLFYEGKNKWIGL